MKNLALCSRIMRDHAQNQFPSTLIKLLRTSRLKFLKIKITKPMKRKNSLSQQIQKIQIKKWNLMSMRIKMKISGSSKSYSSISKSQTVRNRLLAMIIKLAIIQALCLGPTLFKKEIRRNRWSLKKLAHLVSVIIIIKSISHYPRKQ